MSVTSLFQLFFFFPSRFPFLHLHVILIFCKYGWTKPKSTFLYSGVPRGRLIDCLPFIHKDFFFFLMKESFYIKISENKHIQFWPSVSKPPKGPTEIKMNINRTRATEMNSEIRHSFWLLKTFAIHLLVFFLLIWRNFLTTTFSFNKYKFSFLHEQNLVKFPCKRTFIFLCTILIITSRDYVHSSQVLKKRLQDNFGIKLLILLFQCQGYKSSFHC